MEVTGAAAVELGSASMKVEDGRAWDQAAAPALGLASPQQASRHDQPDDSARQLAKLKAGG
jgi:hypothetical protein